MHFIYDNSEYKLA